MALQTRTYEFSGTTTLTIIAAIDDPPVIAKTLTHLGNASGWL